ncbi:prepilin peptidase [bacterium]|nr:prepilin peptidase [bacterium]
MFYLFIFLLGLAVGSFLNCVIYRLNREESLLKGRSFCPYCRHKLAWFDLIPVLSFLILRGKCRYCHKKISLQYPLVELATAFLFLLSVAHFGLSFDLFSLLNISFIFLSLSFLVIIFAYDLKHFIIPDKIIYPAIVSAFLYQVFLATRLSSNIESVDSILRAVFAGFCAGGFFLFIYLLSQGKWMGFGDVKLAVFLGFLVSWPNILVALFFAFLIGAIIGIILILFRKRSLKSEVPFAPFLVAGTLIALFLGTKLIDIYISFFVF